MRTSVVFSQKAHQPWSRLIWIGVVVIFITYHLSLITSCTSIDCPVQTTVQTNYNIVDAEGKALTLNDTLYVWSRRADGTDTLILNRGVGISTFSLPISYQHPEDTLIFYTVNTNLESTLDTVWLKKVDIPHFESVDCAAHFFHKLTDVRSTHQRIDTITINNADVNYDTSVTHINVQFAN